MGVGGAPGRARALRRRAAPPRLGSGATRRRAGTRGRHGPDLGGGVAVHLAAERPLVGVVLVTPFDSLTAVAQRHYPWLPVRWLLNHPFDALARAPSIRTPMLCLVAGSDRIIPPAHAARLFAAWGGPSGGSNSRSRPQRHRGRARLLAGHRRLPGVLAPVTSSAGFAGARSAVNRAATAGDGAGRREGGVSYAGKQTARAASVRVQPDGVIRRIEARA